MKKILVAPKLPNKIVAVTSHTRSGKAIMLKLISLSRKFDKNKFLKKKLLYKFYKKILNLESKFLNTYYE